MVSPGSWLRDCDQRHAGNSSPARVISFARWGKEAGRFDSGSLTEVWSREGVRVPSAGESRGMQYRSGLIRWSGRPGRRPLLFALTGNLQGSVAGSSSAQPGNRTTCKGGSNMLRGHGRPPYPKYRRRCSALIPIPPSRCGALGGDGQQFHLHLAQATLGAAGSAPHLDIAPPLSAL